MNDILAQMEWLGNRFGKKTRTQTDWVRMAVGQWIFMSCDGPEGIVVFYEWSLRGIQVERVACEQWAWSRRRFHEHYMSSPRLPRDASDCFRIRLGVRALQLRWRRRKLRHLLFSLPAHARRVTIAYSGFAQLAFLPEHEIIVV